MILNIDETNISDLKKTITLLQKKRKNLLKTLGYSGISFQGSRVNMDSVYPEIKNMLNTDLSNIYGNPTGNSDYYVYAHCDPNKTLDIKQNLKHLLLASTFGLEFEPFYIGKGKQDRAFDLNRNEGHKKIRSKILASGKDIIVKKLVSNVTENEALSLESKLIDVLGLRFFGRDGILINLDEGLNAKERRMLYSGYGRKILDKNGFKI